MSSVGVAILAAGKGTRLKIDVAKALCPALGRALVDYVVDEARAFGSAAGTTVALTAVVGHKGEEVRAHVEKTFPGTVSFAWQKEQKGTADALRSYFDECPENWKHEYTFVACADTPLLEASTFHRLWDEFASDPSLQACAGTFETAQPKGYGRILRGGKGFRIVEEKDATPTERAVTEVNSGFYLVRTAFLKQRLGAIGNSNKSGEFYLTDLFAQDVSVKAVKFEDATVFWGVNTLVQLEEAAQVLRRRKLVRMMESGVMLLDAASCHVDWAVEAAPGTVLHPGVHLRGCTRLAAGTIVGPGAVLVDSEVGEGAEILAYSHLEGAVVAAGAHVGPFARLRPGSDVGPGAKIGNFVETKKARLGAGAKVSHLSYVGDADIGEGSNIGCGFITCNYDGVNKHKTVVGKNVFIGSDVQAVAPLQIGDNSFVAAGSTVTKDVPAEGFAIARSQQVTKPGMAHRFLKTKKPS